jgi:hypothetical protein
VRRKKSCGGGDDEPKHLVSPANKFCSKVNIGTVQPICKDIHKTYSIGARNGVTRQHA